MKIRTKRLLALALSLIMIFSCMGMGVFAADEETVRQYGKEGGYLAIGDSVCRGCGTAGYPQPYYNYAKRNVEGSFPYIVAKAVGCTMPEEIIDQSGNYWPLCYPGMTLGGMKAPLTVCARCGKKTRIPVIIIPPRRRSAASLT